VERELTVEERREVARDPYLFSAFWTDEDQRAVDIQRNRQIGSWSPSRARRIQTLVERANRNLPRSPHWIERTRRADARVSEAELRRE
jgi:hypothetical protein